MLKKILILILILLLLSGCATGFVVQVNAITEPNIDATQTRYVLRNGNTKDGEKDLFFLEFSAYFIPLLATKGYQRVEMSEDADLEIFFRYTVSEGREGVNTFTHPIYEFVGGNAVNIIDSTTDSSGVTITRRRTVNTPLQTVYVGTSVDNYSYTSYTSSAALEAYVLKPDGKILWKTLMNVTAESNDLRTTIPAMAAAAAPYLAGNSGAAIYIQLNQNDPKIDAIRKNARQ